jgi:hypothetical protein
MLRKYHVFKIILTLFIPLLLSACENSTENNPPEANTGSFPNKVGDQWVYAVHDSLNGSVDTLTVNIIGTTTGNGKNLTIWARKSHTYNDTLYVYLDNNTVYYYNDPYPDVVDHKFVFPLEVGKSWTNPDQAYDSSIVKKIEPVSVPADEFLNAYRIERNWGGFNVYGYSITWFVENVGIVKFYKKVQGFDNIRETWELLSYNVQ